MWSSLKMYLLDLLIFLLLSSHFLVYFFVAGLLVVSLSLCYVSDCPALKVGNTVRIYRFSFKKGTLLVPSVQMEAVAVP